MLKWLSSSLFSKREVSSGERNSNSVGVRSKLSGKMQKNLQVKYANTSQQKVEQKVLNSYDVFFVRQHVWF